jgi:hypothetical protein
MIALLDFKLKTARSITRFLLSVVDDQLCLAYAPRLIPSSPMQVQEAAPPFRQ